MHNKLLQNFMSEITELAMWLFLDFICTFYSCGYKFWGVEVALLEYFAQLEQVSG